MASFPIKSKADHTPAAPVDSGRAVSGPAKSNPGNRKEKRYLIFVQNREPEKIFLIPCEAGKAVIHEQISGWYLPVETDWPSVSARAGKWISSVKFPLSAWYFCILINTVHIFCFRQNDEA